MNPITKIKEMDADRALFIIGTILIVTSPMLVIDLKALIEHGSLLAAPMPTMRDGFFFRAVPIVGCFAGVAFVIASFILRRRNFI